MNTHNTEEKLVNILNEMSEGLQVSLVIGFKALLGGEVEHLCGFFDGLLNIQAHAVQQAQHVIQGGGVALCMGLHPAKRALPHGRL